MLSKSARYYRRNKAARERKKATDTVINSRPEQVRKRVESNIARRRAKRRGVNVRGKDYDHKVGKFVPVKTNRGRRGEGNR